MWLFDFQPWDGTNDYRRKKGRGLQLPSFFAGEARSEGRAAVNGNDSSRRRLNGAKPIPPQ